MMQDHPSRLNSNEQKPETMRLNKYIAAKGYCSRRHADLLIEQGLVKINRQVASLGTQVKPDDIVEVEGKIISEIEEEKVYLALNKPRGIICTANPKVKNNIIAFLNFPQRVFTIGRLDKDSEGLILLTNDGAIFNRIVRAEFEHEKEYLVELNKPYDQEFIEKMEQGVEILDTTTKPAKVTPISSTKFKLIITQGLNRQIRRMCDALGYQVIFLRRLRIMNIDLGGLKVGQYRKLTEKEKRDMFSLLNRKEDMLKKNEKE